MTSISRCFAGTAAFMNAGTAAFMNDGSHARRPDRGIVQVVATAVVIAFALLASTSCASERDLSVNGAPATFPASVQPLPLTSQPVVAPVPFTSQPVGAGSRVVVIGDSYTGG